MLTTNSVSNCNDLKSLGDNHYHHPILLLAKSEDNKKCIKTSPTSRLNEHTIDKLLNDCPSTSSPPSSTTSSVSPLITSSSPPSLPSPVVLSHLNKSQLPIDIIAQTLWLQHQHLQHKLNSTPNRTLFSGHSPLLQHNNSPPILGESAAQSLRRYLLPAAAAAAQQRQNRGPRRQRTTFTHEQTLRLEMEYHVSEYITRGKRFQLAELLDLSENQIKIWFQNRRAKDKRIEKAIVEQQYRYLSSPTFSQHLNVSNCTTCNYTKQQFNNDSQN